jgi:hypothetical protein
LADDKNTGVPYIADDKFLSVARTLPTTNFRRPAVHYRRQVSASPPGEKPSEFCRKPYFSDFFPYLADDKPYITDDNPYITDI